MSLLDTLKSQLYDMSKAENEALKEIEELKKQLLNKEQELAKFKRAKQTVEDAVNEIENVSACTDKPITQQETIHEEHPVTSEEHETVNHSLDFNESVFTMSSNFSLDDVKELIMGYCNIDYVDLASEDKVKTIISDFLNQKSGNKITIDGYSKLQAAISSRTGLSNQEVTEQFYRLIT